MLLETNLVPKKRPGSFYKGTRIFSTGGSYTITLREHQENELERQKHEVFADLDDMIEEGEAIFQTCH